MVVIETAVERLQQRRPLGVELPAGQVGKDLWVPFAGDEGFDHRSGRHPQQVRRHRRQLDQGVLEQLLEALLVSGPLLDELGPQPGVVPQHPDLPGRNEARAEHAPLAEFGQPHRVELVGLGAASHLFDVTGVDQPHRQARGLQQVEERPPIVRRRLQHHPFHPERDQFRTQGQDRVRGRLHLPHPRGAAALDRRMRPPDTDHARRLGHIDGGGDGKDPFGLVFVDLDDVAVRLQEHLQGSADVAASEPGGPGGVRKSDRRARGNSARPF